MIIDVRGRPYSQYRPAYMRARQEFSGHPNKPKNADTRLYLQEFGKFIGANVIFEYFEETDLAKVSGLEFTSGAAYAWFLLRYS
jgi:hypothetical protein